MTVLAPRIEDMDPNHPKNLKKLEPKKEKYDEYKPYPPAEGEFQSLSMLMRSTRHPPEWSGRGSTPEIRGPELDRRRKGKTR